MRVAIAEDAVLFRAGLASLLTDAGVTVTASVGSAEELLAAIDRDPPDAAIIDIRMPPTHTTEGLQAAARIAAATPDVGVLILSQHVEAHYALRLINQRPRGAGYLLKERVMDVGEFVDSVGGSPPAAWSSTPRSSRNCWPARAAKVRSTGSPRANTTCCP
jgi:DNA-binding NarL/FixJ family response regulator